MINVVNLSVKLGSKQVLSGVNLEFESGVLNILGQNGCGKSTLLKAILKLVKFSGDVLINSQNSRQLSYRDLAKALSYIPQSNFTPFNYSVKEMVLMGRVAHKGIFENYSKNDEKIALNALDELGILTLASEQFLRLSGGQKQLVLIARALATQSKIILMDEPVNGLDFGNQIKLLDMIKSLANAGYSFIITTHHPRQAKFIGGRSVLIQDGAIFANILSKDLDENLISKLYKIDYNKYKDIL
ncbi:ABC transporter, ATP-binding protein [Campylobacter iguaniorum]|uniref:ABC transporter, ATP-binding protein n=1 Tax=Campylobacter iguaniorum TaxID=1244531 RepID=A0A076F8Z2_9BACT|nr:ABC transporter ATP-binding protein [Campylobacter iguaniorum]AII14163.1 ABC transporter, ATP-binding protein [Campylobacter iguaniorum]